MKIPVPTADMGKGKEAERAIKQIGLQYGKLKHTLPFPLALRDVYATLVPDIKRTLWIETPTKATCMADNLTLSVMWGRTVHVSLDPPAEYVKAIKGDHSFSHVFHMVFPEDVIVPAVMTNPYRMDKTNPHYDVIKLWAMAADTLEGRWERQLGMVNTFFRYANSANAIQQAWPEISSYLRLKGPSMSRLPKEMIRRMVAKVPILQDSKTRKQVIENLAAASLLQDEAVDPPAAWVSFKTV